jgi:hypothetical protein
MDMAGLTAALLDEFIEDFAIRLGQIIASYVWDASRHESFLQIAGRAEIALRRANLARNVTK